jgi:hypothetical protein
MCAACSPGQTHVMAAADSIALAAVASAAAPELNPPALNRPVLNPPARFAALRSRDCRWYLGGGLLSMMADNIEQYICECR